MNVAPKHNDNLESDRWLKELEEKINELKNQVQDLITRNCLNTKE